ncbi:MAG TPA: hypothetical protein VF049_22180 [Nocardioidaceae bacterium]
MDQTPRGYVFPECDPPEVKDLSDIGQMRALAEAIDADMTGLAATANTALLQPDAIRMISPTVSMPAGGNADPVFSTTTWTNNPAMDGPVGVLAPVSGWYLVGTFTVITLATDAPRLTGFKVNGGLVTPLSDQPGVYSGGNATALYLSRTLHLNAGDHLTVLINSEGGAAYSYTSRLWALRMVSD